MVAWRQLGSRRAGRWCSLSMMTSSEAFCSTHTFHKQKHSCPFYLEGRDISPSAFLSPVRRHLNSRARYPLDNILKFPILVSHLGWILSLRRDQRDRQWRNKQNLKIGLAWSHFCFWQVFTVVAQSLSLVWLFVTPWTAACQASLSFTITC